MHRSPDQFATAFRVEKTDLRKRITITSPTRNGLGTSCIRAKTCIVPTYLPSYRPAKFGQLFSVVRVPTICYRVF